MVPPLGAAHAPSPDARYGHPDVRKPNRVSDGDLAAFAARDCPCPSPSGRRFSTCGARGGRATQGCPCPVAGRSLRASCQSCSARDLRTRRPAIRAGWGELRPRPGDGIVPVMATSRKREIRDQDVQGLKCLRKIRPLLSRLRKVGTERDRAGNRRLFMDQYCALIMMSLFSPAIESLRDPSAGRQTGPRPRSRIPTN